MLALALVSVLAVASVCRGQPSSGECICFTGDAVNIRDAGCGNVIGSANSGACFTATGGTLNCDLSGTNYNYWEFNYNSGTGWSADTYLTTSPSSSCAPVVGCDDLTMVSRAAWGARAPTSTTPLNLPLNKDFVHHSAGASCSTNADCEAAVRGIQNYHMDSNGWSDIGYNFLIGGDGRVYEGRGWNNQGAHASEWNPVSYGCCMIGTFTDVMPVASAMTALQNWIDCGIELGNVVSGYTLHGHRDGGATECPGNMLYAEISTWPNFGGDLP